MSEPYLGEIKMFGGNFAPRGYAMCSGQLLSISQNTALFSILGTTFGGNGQSTFGLPDFRGRSPIHQGQGPGLSPMVLGEASGSESVTLLSSQMPMHVHPLGVSTAEANLPSPGTGTSFGAATDKDGNPVNLYVAAAPNVTLSQQSVGIAGGSQPVGLRNPFLTVTFIIATEGLFPTRN